jgi:GTPase SAR1 family protein
VISEDRLKEIVRELLAEHLEAQADWRSRIPSMVIIYPLDQNYLRSGFVGQKWMLKLCCMAPGEEHPLEGGDGVAEGETHPELGWYRLNDLGEWTGQIIKWAKSHERILKLVSKGLGAALGWVHQDAVTSFLRETAESVSGLNIPDSPVPPGGGEYLPVSSELIRLAGLRESDYRVLEGQGLIFIQKVLEKQMCGNLHLFIRKGRMLWLCNRHLDKMKAEREAVETARSEDLLSKYLQRVESQVRKIYILGDSEPQDLKEIFVELTTINERERPSSQTQAEYLGLLDSELRRLRNPLLDRGSGENQTFKLKGRRVQPEDILQSNVRPLIVGAPGSGKSTLLRYLAYKTLEENEQLPVFLELKTIEKRDFDAAEGKLTDLIFEVALAKSVCETDSDRALMRKEFYQRLKAGSVSIFLDGLDEVSGKEFFGALRQSVKDFLQNSEYRQNNLCISTRPYALLDRFSHDEVQEMEIAPFNQKQIKQFINNYYPGDQQADRFLTELQLHPVKGCGAIPFTFD